VEATERLRRQLPAAAVIALTTYSDDSWVFPALRAGARGFLTKDAGADEIHRAITDVAAGHAQFDPSVQRRLLDALHRGTAPAVAPAAAPVAPVARPGAGMGAGMGVMPDDLTPREAEVLAHIAAGLSNSEIAATLFVSEATVKTHVNHIFAKTGRRDRAQLVRYAFVRGIALPG
jgi:DNA-binding NarL/FixJ family response regulator